MRKSRWIGGIFGSWALASAACLGACSGDDELALNLFDGGFDAPAAYDTGADGTFSDGATDAAPDSASDSGFDSAMFVDAGHDSGIDAAIFDAGQDAGVDAGLDGSIEPGIDASDDAGDAGDAAIGDGGVTVDASLPINDCTTFVDATAPAASRVINGPPNSAPVQYTPACLMIKTGQSVTFQQQAFSDHPLEPANGTTPSPIAPTNSGASVSFLFASQGTYGFECEFHPMLMHGAILVVP